MSDWVLLPAYNEAATLGILLDKILPQGYNVLVVDDGSHDATAAIARSRGCSVLRHEKNLGKGMALRNGFDFLLARDGWNVVVVMDADGQHDTAEIKVLQNAHDLLGADVVVGNRMLQASGMPMLRWMTNRVTSALVSKLAGQLVSDSQCGFRSIRRLVLQNLHLSCKRFDLESEMLIQASMRGYKIASVPVRTIYDNQPSRIHPIVDTLRFLRMIARYGFLICTTRLARLRNIQPASKMI